MWNRRRMPTAKLRADMHDTPEGPGDYGLPTMACGREPVDLGARTGT